RRFANLQSALHINKRLCTYARGSAHMHAALHIFMSSRPMCKAPCLCAKSSACMQRGVFMMCSSACICARRSVHLQIPLHVCTTACLLAAGLACMHGGVFILQRAVYMCRASCWFARVCACVQRGVFILHVHMHACTWQFQPEAGPSREAQSRFRFAERLHGRGYRN